MQLNAKLVTTVEGFAALQKEWEKLEQLDPECTPFNTWLWLSIWWKHYAVGGELRLVTCYCQGELISIAPLYVAASMELSVVPVRTMRFLGAGGDTTADYLNFICHPEHKAAAIAVTLDNIFRQPDWQRLDLSAVPADSDLLVALNAACEAQAGMLLPRHRHTIYYADLPQNFEQFRQHLSRKRRKQINHRQNRLDQAGVSSLSICQTLDEMTEATEALINLHLQRWDSKGEAGGFQSANYVGFHKELIAASFARDRIWLVTLSLNDAIIGVQYVLDWRNTLWFFQSGFAPEYEHLSPGHVLFTYVIREAIARHYDRIDMLRGKYAYKTLYASQVRHTVNTHFVRPGKNQMVTWAKHVAKVVLHREVGAGSS